MFFAGRQKTESAFSDGMPGKLCKNTDGIVDEYSKKTKIRRIFMEN